MMDNARSPRITAAAGTRLAGASSLATVIFLANERALQPIWGSLVPKSFCAFLTHATSLDQACADCPIFPTADLVWTLSQFQCG